MPKKKKNKRKRERSHVTRRVDASNVFISVEYSMNRNCVSDGRTLDGKIKPRIARIDTFPRYRPRSRLIDSPWPVCVSASGRDCECHAIVRACVCHARSRARLDSKIKQSGRDTCVRVASIAICRASKSAAALKNGSLATGTRPRLEFYLESIFGARKCALSFSRKISGYLDSLQDTFRFSSLF